MKGEKGKGFDRGLEFYEKLQYGIGAIALAGAAIFPEFSAPLAVYGVIQFAQGALVRIIRNRRNQKKPLPTPA